MVQMSSLFIIQFKLKILQVVQQISFSSQFDKKYCYININNGNIKYSCMVKIHVIETYKINLS